MQGMKHFARSQFQAGVTNFLSSDKVFPDEVSPEIHVFFLKYRVNFAQVGHMLRFFCFITIYPLFSSKNPTLVMLISVMRLLISVMLINKKVCMFF